MTRKKLAATTLPAPQSRKEAAAHLKRIGEIGREVAGIEAAMNEAIAGAKEAAEKRSTPLADEAEQLLGGLQVWASANRDKITDGGKVKSADIGTGTIGWRVRPASATVRLVEQAIAYIEERVQLQQFLRIKKEINKEAMISNPALANTIPGVTVKSAGETFYAEPLELQLASAVAAAQDAKEALAS